MPTVMVVWWGYVQQRGRVRLVGNIGIDSRNRGAMSDEALEFCREGTGCRPQARPTTVPRAGVGRQRADRHTPRPEVCQVSGGGFLAAVGGSYACGSIGGGQRQGVSVPIGRSDLRRRRAQGCARRVSRGQAIRSGSRRDRGKGVSGCRRSSKSGSPGESVGEGITHPVLSSGKMAVGADHQARGGERDAVED